MTRKPATDPFAPMPIRAPRLSRKALASIERIARWEDDSHREVLGEEPPHPWPGPDRRPGARTKTMPEPDPSRRLTVEAVLARLTRVDLDFDRVETRRDEADYFVEVDADTMMTVTVETDDGRPVMIEVEHPKMQDGMRPRLLLVVWDRDEQVRVAFAGEDVNELAAERLADLPALRDFAARIAEAVVAAGEANFRLPASEHPRPAP